MKKAPIGHVICPVCGHDDAEVKEDKNGHAFIFCTDCAAQTFTRNDYRNNHLRKRMRPVTVTVTDTVPDTVTVPNAPDTKPEPLPLPRNQEEAEKVANLGQVKKASWFQPVLGSAKR